MSACRSCGAPIEWAITEGGARMPVDVQPVLGGNVLLGLGPGGVRAARVLSGDELATSRARGPLWTAHFVTCPDASQHRRRGS